jgi:hypothetical protein
MVWNPRKKDLEVIADLIAARTPVAAIANELHVTAEDFTAWRRAMLEATANEEQASVDRPARHWSRESGQAR